MTSRRQAAAGDGTGHPATRRASAIWTKNSSGHTRSPSTGRRSTVSPESAIVFCRSASATTGRCAGCRRAGCRRAGCAVQRGQVVDRRAEARWPTGSRRPARSAPSAQSHPRARCSPYIGAGRRRRSDSASRSCSRRASPVTLTTCAGGASPYARASTRAPPSRDRPHGRTVGAPHRRDRRVTQSVCGDRRELPERTARPRGRHPTTSTRLAVEVPAAPG